MFYVYILWGTCQELTIHQPGSGLGNRPGRRRTSRRRTSRRRRGSRRINIDDEEENGDTETEMTKDDPVVDPEELIY
jgi:hypothetical protein